MRSLPCLLLLPLVVACHQAAPEAASTAETVPVVVAAAHAGPIRPVISAPDR